VSIDRFALATSPKLVIIPLFQIFAKSDRPSEHAVVHV
jgi:hypothetical protein